MILMLCSSFSLFAFLALLMAYFAECLKRDTPHFSGDLPRPKEIECLPKDFTTPPRHRRRWIEIDD